MNIQSSLPQTRLSHAKLAVAQQEKPAPPSQDKEPTINWDSVTRTASTGAAYVGGAAALSLLGTVTGRSELALVGIVGAGIAASLVEQNPRSLIGGMMLGALGANGAALGGVAGAVAATAFGGGVFGLHDYLNQTRSAE